jgi:hypothetical protein
LCRRKLDAALGRLDIDDLANVRKLAKACGEQAVVCANARSHREVATHDAQAIRKVVGNARQEKIRQLGIALGRDAVSPLPDQFLVENLRRASHRNPSMKVSLPMRPCAKLQQ